MHKIQYLLVRLELFHVIIPAITGSLPLLLLDALLPTMKVVVPMATQS